MKVTFLDSPELIDRHWPAVENLIGPSVEELAKGEFNVDDLLTMVRYNSAHAGLVESDSVPVLAVVFEFRYYPRCVALHVLALAGKNLSEAAMTFWPVLQCFAKEFGATRVEAHAGRAMSRILCGAGFQHQYDFLKVEINQEV